MQLPKSHSFRIISIACFLLLDSSLGWSQTWSLDLDGWDLGTVHDAKIRTLPGFQWADLDDRLSVVQDRSQQSPFFRVTYPKGKIGSENSGAQFRMTLPKGERYVCEYRVRFGPDFDFRKGGKMPGLAGGRGNTGGKRPTGDGWSARYMWRDSGRLSLYLYHLDQPGRYGGYFDTTAQFETDRWYRLRQEVRLNHPDRSDGVITVWVDGKVVLRLPELRLRVGEKAPIDSFYFSTFFGGSTSSWAPSHDCAMDFGGLTIVRR